MLTTGLRRVLLLSALGLVLVPDGVQSQTAPLPDQGLRVEASDEILKLVEAWGQGVQFFTNQYRPLRSLDALIEGEVAVAGVDVFDRGRDLLRVMWGVNPEPKISVLLPEIWNDRPASRPVLYIAAKPLRVELEDAIPVVFTKLEKPLGTVSGVLTDSQTTGRAPRIPLYLFKYLRGDDGRHGFQLWLSVGGVRRVFSTRTDDRGRFEFTGVPEGDYILQGCAPGQLSCAYLDAGTRLSEKAGFVVIGLRPGQTLDLGNVLLKP